MDLSETASAIDADPTIFVADDDAAIRDSLDVLFDAASLACEIFASGDELLKRMSGTEAGCILLDYFMPGRNGLETLKALRERNVGLPVIMITAHGEVGLAVQAMKAGASDFIEKPWEQDRLLGVLKRAIELDRSKRDIVKGRHEANAIIESFTPREKEVFDELITGASNKVIARSLKISPRTVEFYRSNVFEKSGSTSVAELVRLAFIAGLMQA
jgi:two-component system, LuxR family, response regulator FixJ